MLGIPSGIFLLASAAYAGPSEALPIDLLKPPSNNAKINFDEQAVSDIEYYWSGIVKNPRRFETVGDIQPLYSLNIRSAEVWQRLVECHQGDLEALRRDYAIGKLCPMAPDENNLQEKLHAVREETRGWLATSVMASHKDPRFGELENLNPIKKYSDEVYREKYGYNTFIKFHTLWIQIVFEIAATEAVYDGLDEAEWKKVLQVYKVSHEQQWAEWRQQLINRGQSLSSHPSDALWSEPPVPSGRDNAAFQRLYTTVRSLHTVLKLNGYLNPQECTDRGLFPEFAQVIVEGWSAPLLFTWDPEFGELYRSDVTRASVWNNLACHMPAFMENFDPDRNAFQKLGALFSKNQRTAKGVRRDFFRVVKFYRSLDAFYGQNPQEDL